MEKERREEMRVLLFEGQQVANQSLALVLGAPVLRPGQEGGRGTSAHGGPAACCSLP